MGFPAFIQQRLGARAMQVAQVRAPVWIDSCTEKRDATEQLVAEISTNDRFRVVSNSEIRPLRFHATSRAPLVSRCRHRGSTAKWLDVLLGASLSTLDCLARRSDYNAFVASVSVCGYGYMPCSILLTTERMRVLYLSGVASPYTCCAGA